MFDDSRWSHFQHRQHKPALKGAEYVTQTLQRSRPPARDNKADHIPHQRGREKISPETELA